jgi:hypothetical protein
LPAPAHLRLGSAASAASVLAGASGLLASQTLKTVFCTMPSDEGEAFAARLSALNWVVSQRVPLSRGRAQMLLSREPAAVSNTLSDRT